MKKKRLLMLFGVICLALVVASLPFLAACAKPAPAPAPAPTPKPEPIVLKGVTHSKVGDKQSIKFEYFMELVEKRTNGRVSFNYLGGPEVIPGKEQAEAIARGLVDAGQVSVAYYAGVVPLAIVTRYSTIPLSEFRSSGAMDFMVEIHKAAGLYYLGPGVPLSWDKVGCLLYMGLNVRVEKFEDLAGLRAGSVSGHDWMKKLGLIPMALSGAERYPAMERGLIDAYHTILSQHIDLGLAEVTKYILDVSFYNSMGSASHLMNLETWNKLSPDLQDIIKEAHIEHEEREGNLGAAEQAEYRQKLIDAGMEFIKLSPADAERFINTIYGSEWSRLKQKYPEADLDKLEKILMK